MYQSMKEALCVMHDIKDVAPATRASLQYAVTALRKRKRNGRAGQTDVYSSHVLKG